MEWFVVLLRGLHRQSMKFYSSIWSERRCSYIISIFPLLNEFHVRLMGHLSIVLLIRYHFDAWLFDRRVVPGFRRRYLLNIHHMAVISRPLFQILRTFNNCRWSLIGACVQYSLICGNLLAKHDSADPICSRFWIYQVAHLCLLLFFNRLHCLLSSLSLPFHIFLEFAFSLAVVRRAFTALARNVKIQIYFHIGIYLWTCRLNHLFELRIIIPSKLSGVLRMIIRCQL